MADYIPAADSQFEAWQQNFVTYASANAAALGLDPLVDIPPLTAAQTTWATDYPAHIAAQQAAAAATQTKTASRDGFGGAVIRPLVRRLQADAAVDDAEKAALGITVPDSVPTPTGPPTTRPLATIDCGQRLQQTITFMDESTPTKKAKPPGVMGAEIWVKVGDPAPIDPDELSFLAVDTRTPYTTTFPGADGGKTAHYMLRWVNSVGEKGPWSETVSATITA